MRFAESINFNTMDQKTENQTTESRTIQSPKRNSLLSASILISAVILSGAWIYTTDLKAIDQSKTDAPIASEKNQTIELEEKVFPAEGVTLPVVWGYLGAKLVSVGAIDADKLKAIYDH